MNFVRIINWISLFERVFVVWLSFQKYFTFTLEIKNIRMNCQYDNWSFLPASLNHIRVKFFSYCLSISTNFIQNKLNIQWKQLKMSFIWDDEQYMLIDEEEEYDKRRFFITRKLFVTPKTSNNDVSDSFVSWKCFVRNNTILFIFSTGKQCQRIQWREIE